VDYERYKLNENLGMHLGVSPITELLFFNIFVRGLTRDSEDAAAEMTRMEEVESARREQQKLSGGGESKEKLSKKMFRVV
jgi:hypothetical protein